MESLIIFLTVGPTSRKSAKLFTRKLLPGVYIKEPARAIKVSVCWSHRIVSGFAGVLHYRVFSDVVRVKKKNQDSFKSLTVAFEISHISYFICLHAFKVIANGAEKSGISVPLKSKIGFKK